MTSEEEFFSVAVEQAGQHATVAVQGEVDVATAPQLWEAIESISNDTMDLVIDVAKLTFMDSTGIRVLIRAQQLMTDRSGRLVVRSPDAATRKLLEVTSVDKVITVE